MLEWIVGVLLGWAGETLRGWLADRRRDAALKDTGTLSAQLEAATAAAGAQARASEEMTRHETSDTTADRLRRGAF